MSLSRPPSDPPVTPATARVVLLCADPAARNGRGASMADGLARAGYRVTLHVREDVEIGLTPDPAVTVVRSLAADGWGRVGAPHLDLADAELVQVDAPGLLADVAGRLATGTRLVYDVPGAAPETPVVARSGWSRRVRQEWKTMRLAVAERRGVARANAVLCSGYMFGQYLQREFQLQRVPVVPLYAAPPFCEVVTPVAAMALDGPVVAVLAPSCATLEVAIRAMARLRKVHLLVINPVETETWPVETETWETCRGWAREAQVAARLHRATVAPTRVLSALAACDVGLVLPTDRSQRALYDIPDALFSFIMAGTPVVASWLPGIERLVGNHQFGFLSDPTDRLEVADQMARILFDPGVRERLVHNADVVRRKRYSWEVQERRLLDLYSELLGPPPIADAMQTMGDRDC